MALRIGKIKPSSTVFFLCDIQERFRNLISYMPSVIHVAQRMTAASRALDIPTIVTEQNPSRLGKTVPEIDISGFPLHEKTLFSMCTPDINQYLKGRELKSAVIFGIEAHVCVLQTALDLLERGVDVHIVADGVSSRKSSDRYIAFERLKQSGAFITTSESLLFQLMGGSTHPAFKTISALHKDSSPEPGITKRRVEKEEESRL